MFAPENALATDSVALDHRKTSCSICEDRTMPGGLQQVERSADSFYLSIAAGQVAQGAAFCVQVNWGSVLQNSLFGENEESITGQIRSSWSCKMRWSWDDRVQGLLPWHWPSLDIDWPRQRIRALGEVSLFRHRRVQRGDWLRIFSNEDLEQLKFKCLILEGAHHST